MVEGDRKPCGSCGTEIVHVKIIKEFKGQVEAKLQWQNIDDARPHFKWIGEKDGKAQFDCMKPTQESVKQHQADVQEELEVQTKPTEPTSDPNIIIPKSPFEESELIVRWARGIAYKMSMEGVHSFDTLSVQEKNSLGQKEGMLTRALVDTTIELMKIHGVKADYGK